ncbi:taste receptor type 2 member 9-like, partial [Emydura macquarii macquarii]|uniref:taste receptor type 2 member 9-like n=1 Tax=Emydura macquarii macquarii TaxID=1129001 RepID=UPI00352AC425
MFPVIIIVLIILGVEFIIGIIANGLMIVVNCREWIRSRKLTCCDMILTSLGISRIFLQCVILINNIFSALPPGMKGLCDIWRTFYAVWVYLNILSLWFATWLSVFYCVKIANFSQCLFLWLKQKISGLLPKLLLGSLLVSLVTCLPAVNYIHKKYIVLFLSKMFVNSSLYFIWFCVVVMAAYPSGHSVILIMGNPKLKRTMLNLGLHDSFFLNVCELITHGRQGQTPID